MSLIHRYPMFVQGARPGEHSRLRYPLVLRPRAQVSAYLLRPPVRGRPPSQARLSSKEAPMYHRTSSGPPVGLHRVRPLVVLLLALAMAAAVFGGRAAASGSADRP